MLKQSHLNQRYELEEMIKIKYPQQIRDCKDKIENLAKDFAVDKKLIRLNTIINKDNFSPMTINNQIYNERSKAGEKILELCTNVDNTKETYIGDYRGFKMYLEFNTFEKLFQVVLKNKRIYRVTLGSDKIGVIIRINNLLESIEKMIEDTNQELQNLELQYKNAQETVNIPFSQEEELQNSLSRLKEVNKLLKIGELKDSINDDEMDRIGKNNKNKKKIYVR